MHGHNYTVDVVFESSTLTPDSFVRDPADYRRIELFIRRTFDRQNLNEIFAAEFEGDLRAALCNCFKGDFTDITEHYEKCPSLQESTDEALRTTTENIARAIYLRLKSDFPQIIAVKVGDTPETWASYQEAR